MTQPVDIRPADLAIVHSILEDTLPKDARVWVFGSRAKWTTKDSSDLDLAVDAGRALTRKEQLELSEAFEESDLPYKVDVVDMQNVSESFKAIIERNKTYLPWRTVEIGSVAQIFDGPHATPETVDAGPIFLGIGALDNGRINLGETRHVTQEDFKKWTRRVFPQKDDVVFSYETRIGQAAIIPEGLECCLGRRMGLVRTDPDRLDPRFFLYNYISPDYQEFLRSKTISGATVDRLAIKEFPSFPIQLPSLEEQKAIVTVLGALDDKIELNRKTNATLEAMARALFKSWFVDFDPVKAKMEGRQPFGMDAATAALFPDALDDEDIPVGWNNSPLSSLIDLIGGGTPKTSEASYWGGDIPWFSVVDAPCNSDVFAITTEKTITEAGLSNSSTRLIPRGATIITARGTVGKLAMVASEMAMNQSCYAATSKYAAPYFTYFTLRAAVSSLQSNTHGSVFDTITRATFDAVSSIEPKANVVSAFDGVVCPLMDRIEANLRESSTLAQLRDLLLPKLISGEIRLKDAEEAVEAV